MTTQHFFIRVAHQVIRFRVPILVATVVLTTLFAWAALHIVINNSNDEFFIKDDPNLIAYQTFQKTFGNEEALLVYVDRRDIFSLDSYHELHKLIEAIRGLKYHDGPMFPAVLSPYDAPIVKHDGESINVTTSLDQSKVIDQASLDHTREIMVNHPIYRNLLIDSDGIAGAIVINLHPSMDEKYSVFAAKTVDQLLKSPEFAHIQAVVVGGPSLKYNIDSATATESTFFGAAALIMCLLTMLLMFRRFEQVFGTVLILFLAVVWTMGLMSLLHVEMTLVTIILPLVIIITGLGTCVHIVTAFRRRIERGMTPVDAITRAMGETGLACLYTSLTSSVGFLSMMTAPVSPMRLMGLFAAVGIMVNYLLIFTLLPITLGNRMSRRKASSEPMLEISARDKLFGAIAAISLKHPLVTTIVCAVVTLTMASGIFFVKIESNFVQALSKQHPQRIAIERVDKGLGGSFSLEVVIDTGKANGVYEPDVLKQINELGTWAKTTQSDVVTAVMSPTLILEEINQALIGTRTLPQTSDAAAQLMFLYEISGGNIRSVVSADGRQARISLRSRTASTTRELQLENDVMAHLGNGDKVTLTGINSLFVHLSDYVVSSQLNSFASAGLIIAILMMWILRSWKLGLMTLLPNTLPILATYGMMGWIGLPIDWLSAVIPGVALGVAVDDTIHIATHYQKSRRKGHSSYEAAHHVIQNIGRAITVSTLALIAGFCVFAFSILDSLAHMGFLLAFALLLALVLNLVMTPAILALKK